MDDAEKEKIRKQVLNDIKTDIDHLQEILVDASIIASGRGYQATGWDALYLLFADRFSWTPEKVRSLTIPELGWLFDVYFDGEF